MICTFSLCTTVVVATVCYIALPTILLASCMKSWISSSSESPLSSSILVYSLVVFLIPAGLLSSFDNSPCEGVQAYCLVTTMLLNMMSYLADNEGSMPTCLNFFAPLIYCVMKVRCSWQC